MKDQLVFNTAATSDSDNVGAYIRAGSNGDLIGDQTIAASKWLQVASAVFDGSGNAITSTSNALDVNVMNDTFQVDVGQQDNTTFTVGTSIEQPVGGVYATSFTAITTGKTGAFAMSAYRAMHVSINDEAGNQLIGQKTMAGSLPVAIASDQSTVPVSDAALANTAINSNQANVTTTVGNLIATPLANRKYLFIQNLGNQSIYIGQSGITTGTGFRVPAGSTFMGRIGAAVSVYAIATSGTQTTAYLEAS